MELYSTPIIILSMLFIVVNICAFIVLAWDKYRAVSGSSHKRISEGLLFFMAVAFGSIGVYVAMWVFRHKTKKWYFVVGIPLVIIQNCSTLYAMLLFW